MMTSEVRCANCWQAMSVGSSSEPRNLKYESHGIQVVEGPPPPKTRKNGRPVKYNAKVLDVSIPAVLNTILMLPSSNVLTNDVRMCTQCTPVLAKLLVLFKAFQKMSDPKSHLTTVVFNDLKQMHEHVLAKDAGNLMKIKELRAKWLTEEKMSESPIEIKSEKNVGSEPRNPGPGPSRPKSSIPVQPPPPTPMSDSFPETEVPVVIKSESLKLSVETGFIQSQITNVAESIDPPESMEEPSNEWETAGSIKIEGRTTEQVPTKTELKCPNCGVFFNAMKQLNNSKYHTIKDYAPPGCIHACDLPGCHKRFKLKQELVLHYASGFHNLRWKEAREKVYPLTSDLTL